ncbi:outer membrane receptor protein involved in Fe transport [Maribacter vaceletii]|uniref:Outer membrane receptor protein involved in Fe transport n=1 Tax=Maribacter vaceletii TaxID=1206816 RepID=A0A495DTI2_9FLAO|nr:TonB-dependent receptor [Maribacter vaceletii]RKR07936.1 outer membrane receptor protein involved in Fe transport [Maribacter vaceletii]
MKYIFFILFLFSSLYISAQEFQGYIETSNGTPIEGAYIFNKNSQKHAHSNESGYFLIEKTNLGDSLQIGSLGYKNSNTIIKNTSNKRNTYVLNEAPFELNEVVISPKIDALSVVTKIDLQTNPVGSSQEILQKVPGLIIGQHAGGGKAEQLFLRGFDIDHGTDISINVDNMPVNMVSHAHGQGYADLHFVIPETIEKIDFGKGPYNAQYGNFATAGYVGFASKEAFTKNTVKFTYGDYGYKRNLGLFNVLNTKKEKAYIATELIGFDGPFESSQNFERFNVMAKYSSRLDANSKFFTSVSHFTSSWDASGQIPERAVNSGLITRFGAIDDTEGGKTSRTNLNIGLQKNIDKNTFFKANTYYSNYNFLLFSNFTFFLDDPQNGDQIKQEESRNLFGLNTQLKKNLNWGEANVNLELGSGFRTDNSTGNELSHTANRKTTLNNIQLGDIKETNIFGYLNANFTLGNFTLSPALRLDNFNFKYADALSEVYDNKSVSKTAFSPKLNLVYHPNKNTQYYLKSGIGFHSNDARVSVAQNGHKILPKAYGLDLGTILKPTKNFFINAAAWYLYSEQEFVYVGDAGIVEPSGASKRLGIDFGARYQFTNWLFFNTDLTYTVARSVDENSGEDYIPLAPDFTLVGGLNVTNLGKFSGGLQYKHLNNRPANEDNSIVAEGYTVFNLNANYQWSSFISTGITIDNVFDVEWNETQFATTTRLQNETNPVEEIHFTPGTPFFIKANLTFTF